MASAGKDVRYYLRRWIFANVYNTSAMVEATVRLVQVGAGPVQLEFRDRSPADIMIDKLEMSDGRIWAVGRVQTKEGWFYVRLSGEMGDDHFSLELPVNFEENEADEYETGEAADDILTDPDGFEHAYTVIGVESNLP